MTKWIQMQSFSPPMYKVLICGWNLSRLLQSGKAAPDQGRCRGKPSLLCQSNRSRCQPTALGGILQVPSVYLRRWAALNFSRGAVYEILVFVTLIRKFIENLDQRYIASDWRGAGCVCFDSFYINIILSFQSANVGSSGRSQAHLQWSVPNAMPSKRWLQQDLPVWCLRSRCWPFGVFWRVVLVIRTNLLCIQPLP